MKRGWTIALFVLLVNSAYLLAWPSAIVFYMANALLHLALGLVVAVVAVRTVRRWPAFLAAALFGLFLAVAGNTAPHRWALIAHVALAVLGVGLLVTRRTFVLVVAGLASA